MSNPLNSWLSQGEQLYTSALNEFRALEAQLDDLEQKLAAKQQEVNQIAGIIGKPTVEGSRRLSASHSPVADIIDAPHQERLPVPLPHQATPSNSSNATIARALTGKFGR
ncbi:hypothetical protein [Humisphaera borealis]|uniref:Uncharacterized protein n=1 Tax=Humisphaera borealis TaxID=2807512 RepID=A0A7M2WWN0_9BACT|nr:hypothetical protein [Humisphaera borealis]QOV89612.1 hypothetical protein IPV69_26050 [Humisphaera borealis]